jgi:hypothetical protein
MKNNVPQIVLENHASSFFLRLRYKKGLSDCQKENVRLWGVDKAVSSFLKLEAVIMVEGRLASPKDRV